jgi:hypothetical protein
MLLFTSIPDGSVLLYTHGIYREAALYAYKGEPFAKIGSGYVRLLKGGCTGRGKTIWKEIVAGRSVIDYQSFPLQIKQLPNLVAV